MSRPTWDHVWLAVAELMANRSRCPTGAGCVIVDARQRVVATGYAGPPRNFLTPDEERADTCLTYCARPWTEGIAKDPAYRDCPSTHAEVNAFLTSNRSDVEGGTLYVSSTTCFQCAKAVGNSGVTRVVWPRLPGLSYRDEATTIAYLERCAVRVDLVDWPAAGKVCTREEESA